MNFKFNFPASDFGSATEIEFADFNEEDWQLLDEFMVFSDEAHRTRFARELSSYKPFFRMTKTGQVRSTGILPEDETLWAFLHKYRPIILHKERTEFTKICGLLGRHINHPRFNRMLKQWRAEYSGKQLREICAMQQGDLMLTSKTFLDQYLNACEYHRDVEKRQALSGFAAVFDHDARKALVTLLLTFKFSAVSRLRGFIRRLQHFRVEHDQEKPSI